LIYHISVFVAEFKVQSFWIMAVVLWLGLRGDRNKKYQQHFGAGGTIFLV
jgi:hypothetical protein